jgi:hypothetical protein
MLDTPLLYVHIHLVVAIAASIDINVNIEGCQYSSFVVHDPV